MVTIRAKQTVVDDFGKIDAGKTIKVTTEKAQELANLGLVEIISDDDGELAPVKKSKGVVLRDMTEAGGGKVIYSNKAGTSEGPGEEEEDDEQSNSISAGEQDRDLSELYVYNIVTGKQIGRAHV